MMTGQGWSIWRVARRGSALAMALAAGAALAQQTGRSPENILPAPAASPAPTPAPTATPTVTLPASVPPVAVPPGTPVIQPVVPLTEPVMTWTLGDAQALLGVIEGIAAEGLIPADYQPGALRAAIAAGPGTALDAQASRSFAWLVEDMRDGRTRYESRLQWFVVDPDVDQAPTAALMTQALATHDVAGVIAGLAPTAPGYADLKSQLAKTPATDKAARRLLQVNLDRWRWLPRELGELHLMTNVPEFQLRVVKNQEIVLTYRTVVGKPGSTATPQLAETIEAVVFNPTWTVPQSIVKGEGLGPQLLANPARAAREGYKVTKGKDGFITVVQQPGDSNALGRMKIDMPNPHAIYLHDTPSKQYFNHPVRAYSHGCIRTERAVELGMALAIRGAGKTPEEVTQLFLSGKYTRVVLDQHFPIYITYFTAGTDITGKFRTYTDIYGRDAAVLSSFAAPRKAWDGQRNSTEKVIKLDNPL